MSIAVMTAVWARSRHAGSELLMLLALADYSDDDGNSYPAVASLARRCRMTPRNSNYILSALQLSGELRVLKNEGPKGTNRYRIMLSQLGTQALKPASPLKRTSPLKPASATPEAGFPKPLKPASDEPSLNRQEPSKVARKRAAAFDASAIELPDWLPRPIWADWVADRRERRKPISSRAAAGQLKRLADLRNEGHEPEAVIGNSIANGYQGLFAPTDTRSGSGRAARQPVLSADETFTGGRG